MDTLNYLRQNIEYFFLICFQSYASGQEELSR
jgi:hypothetical protein